MLTVTIGYDIDVKIFSLSVYFFLGKGSKISPNFDLLFKFTLAIIIKLILPLAVKIKLILPLPLLNSPNLPLIRRIDPS